MQNVSHAQSWLAFRKWLQKQTFQSLFDFTYWPISCFHVNEKRKESSGSVFRKCWKTKPERMCERGCEDRGRRAGGPVPDGTETNHRSEQERIVQVLPSTFSSFVGPWAFSCRSPWMRRPMLGCLSLGYVGGSHLPQKPFLLRHTAPFTCSVQSSALHSVTYPVKEALCERAKE